MTPANPSPAPLTTRETDLLTCDGADLYLAAFDNPDLGAERRLADLRDRIVAQAREAYEAEHRDWVLHRNEVLDKVRKEAREAERAALVAPKSDADVIAIVREAFAPTVLSDEDIALRPNTVAAVRLAFARCASPDAETIRQAQYDALTRVRNLLASANRKDCGPYDLNINGAVDYPYIHVERFRDKHYAAPVPARPSVTVCGASVTYDATDKVTPYRVMANDPQWPNGFTCYHAFQVAAYLNRLRLENVPTNAELSALLALASPAGEG